MFFFIVKYNALFAHVIAHLEDTNKLEGQEEHRMRESLIYVTFKYNLLSRNWSLQQSRAQINRRQYSIKLFIETHL